jgi:RimJ/RimL family protein N-acetyltransferase
MIYESIKEPFSKNLKGPRILLEFTEAKHTAQVWEFIQRDHAAGGKIYVWVESEDDVANHITNSERLTSGDIDYLIFKEDRIIGSFHIHSVSYCDFKVEFGYAIEKSEEGRGYITEALALVEAELLRLGFNKAIIKCNTENVRSLKVAERNGFLREGTLVQDCMENGSFRDTALYGKLLRADNSRL